MTSPSPAAAGAVQAFAADLETALPEGVREVVPSLASVLLRSEDKLTLAVGSRLYLNEFRYLWGDFAAAAILSGLPISAVFLIAQRYLVSGLGEGSVKG